MYITYKVKNTTIKPKGSYVAVADSVNYIILKFIMSDEWKSCDKIRIITQHRANESLTYDGFVTDGEYTVPDSLIKAPGFVFTLEGVDLSQEEDDNIIVTSQPYELAIKSSGVEREPVNPPAHVKSTFEEAVSELVDATSKVNYVHIRYADTVPTADGDMKESISDYMGVYCGTSKTAPTAYGEYKWHKIKGEQGERGLQGVQGIQGIQGVKGDKGDTGSQGIQGVQGEKGDKGDTGAKGDKGDPFTYADFTPAQLAALKGEKGDKGDKGEQGEQGEQGVQGVQGEKGDKGDKGLQGEKGDTGAKGDKGDPFTYSDFTAEQLAALKGEKGDKGEPGASVDETQLVHKTGDEQIDGYKNFKKPLVSMFGYRVDDGTEVISFLMTGTEGEPLATIRTDNGSLTVGYNRGIKNNKTIVGAKLNGEFLASETYVDTAIANAITTTLSTEV